MTRLFVAAAAAVGLILFVAFIVSRLLRTRTTGLSIRMQIFLALAIIIGAFALTLGVVVVDGVDQRTTRLARQAARDEALTVAAILQSEIDRTSSTLDTIATQLERRHREDGSTSGDAWPLEGLGVELLDPGGRVLYPAGEASAGLEPGAVFVDAQLHDRGKPVGAVRVVKPTIVVEALLADFAPTVLFLSLVLGGAAALAAAWIGRAVAAPIEALSVYSQAVSDGDRVPLPRQAGGREVTRLTHAIDSMRRQLEAKPFVEAFAADLSHELKNPVAAIRASAEVLEESALEEPEEARRFVQRIREAATRIERLLHDLLHLARIEARGPEAFEPISLAALIERSIEAHPPEQRDLIQFESQSSPRVRGDASWLGRSLQNLIDNALTHSSASTSPSDDRRVTILLDETGDFVDFTVTNPGAIPRRVQDQIFRRFVTTRADKGGSGLGLAITRAVAEAHGGRIELLSAGPPEVRFRLRLPRA